MAGWSMTIHSQYYHTCKYAPVHTDYSSQYLTPLVSSDVHISTKHITHTHRLR